jgi:hypothetical protein
MRTGDWLLSFARVDLERLSATRRRRLIDELMALVYGGRIAPPAPTVQDIVTAKQELGGFLNAIAHRNFYQVRSREGRRLSVTFMPLVNTKAPRPTTKKDPGRGPRFKLVQTIGGDLAVSLVQRAATLLQQVGVDRLMACPWTPERGGHPCGVLFLARSRKLFCRVEHSRAAAYRAWVDAKKGNRPKGPQP